MHQEARTYIDKIIRLRRRIMADGSSHSKAAPTSLGVIENYLANYPCDNDRHMARFITTHYNHLLTIIPGCYSKGNNKLQKELAAFQEQANQILNTTTNMIQQISQGVPKHAFFTLAQPHTGTNGRISLDPTKPKTVVECKNPKTGETSQAELHDLFTFNLTDIPDGMGYLSYGLPAEKLIPILLNKYPELKTNPQVEFLLLKRK